jgi:fibronectin type 3 domain-containing protein
MPVSRSRQRTRGKEMVVLVESLESRVLLSSDSTPFVHPGLLETNADFTRMQQEVALGAHPWIDSWDILIANSHAQLTYTPNPVSILIRGTTTVGPENYSQAYNDAAAAYQLALRWKISGDTRYADKAVQILNAWGSTLTEITGDTNQALAAGLYGYQFATDAEIMRTYSGWAPADFAQFQNMMETVFYPENNSFLTNHFGTTSSHYWANWDLCNIASEMAIGVLCDNHSIYDQAITYFKSGLGTGDIENAVYVEYPGKLGQWQESGRDQGHATLGVPLLAAIAQMAWNQGDDLYSYDDNRILSAVEYIAKYNLGYDVPYTTYINSDGVVQATISSASRGDIRPGFETIYNHYVNIEGLAAPYTAAYAAMVRPDGGGGNYGSTSGGFDQLGFNTLTDTLEPIAQGSAPSGLDAVVTGSQAQLSWWGTAYATSYNIKRSTSINGQYVTIATGVTGDTTYIDYGLAPNVTYYYEVSAMTPIGETANSIPTSAVADDHLTGTIIGSPGSFNNSGAGIQDVFDGTLLNYYDAADASGDWAGLDFGAGVTDVITQIRFAPRANYASRMVGGVFQGSNTPDFSSGVQTLYTITSAPAVGVMTTVLVSNPTAFRYVRYLGPANGSCNVAEVEFDGYDSASSAPAVPTGLAATAGPTGVVLNWAAASGAVGYTIQRSTSANGPFTVVATSVTPTTYTDTNAADGSTYYYILSATNAAGSSASTSAVSTSSLAPPTGLSASVTGFGPVNLTWNANPNATSYNVERSLVTDGLYTVIATATGNSYTDSTVTPWTPYYYVVTAVNATSQSRISAEAKVTPAAARLTGTLIGTSGSWGNNPATTAAAALDGNLSTYFDGPTANGDWVGLDLGTATTISDIRYAPRGGYESRMVGGVFQASNSASFTNPVTLYTVTATPTSGVYTTIILNNPTAYRYVRYLSPNGGYGDVAEVEFDHAINPPTVAVAAAASGVTGSQANLSVLGADYFGEANLTYKWSAVGTPPSDVAFSINDSNAAKNTAATFTQPGTYSFLVSITDPEGLWTTTGLTVVIGPTFAMQNGATLDVSLGSAGPVTIGSSGANVTASQGGIQLSFSGISNVVVTDSAAGDTLYFNGPLNVPVTFSNASSSIVNVIAGSMSIAAQQGASINLGSLSIASGASVVLASSTSQATTLNLQNLTLAGSARFDISNNVVFVNYDGSDPIASIAGAIAQGYNGGLWNGSGIISSSAAINATYGVGYTDLAYPVNPGDPPSDEVKMMYTLLGDANLDGVVNGVDFGIVAADFNKGVTGWDQGDFNYDGVVNGIDFGYIAANFNQGVNIAAGQVVATGGSTSMVLASQPTSAAATTMNTVSEFKRRKNGRIAQT